MRLYRERYSNEEGGYNPTFVRDKLKEEYEIEVSEESLRRWGKEERIIGRIRKKRGARKRRKRRSRFGEMVQIDGSEHNWLKKGEIECLLNIVDDATGITLAQMDKGETTYILLKTLKMWVEKYGVPRTVYVDSKKVYVGEKEGSVFELVCKKLGIEIIRARSAQGKGRVERNHGVYQDRFVKELELRRVKTIEEANKVLEEYYIEEVNRRFGVEAENKEDAHYRKEEYGDLDKIFCWESRRQVQNDNTIRMKGEILQLEGGVEIRAKEKVIVRENLSREITVWKGEAKIEYRKIKKEKKIKERKEGSYDMRKRGRKGKKNESPWRQYNPEWLKSKRNGINRDSKVR